MRNILIQNALKGQRAAIARLISKIESRDVELPAFIRELHPHTGKAQIWGITGPPGAGKSTLVSSLIGQLRKSNLKVAVVAVDPSSPFTGGAILGDRIRMQEHALDEGVFIRSLGTRGRHGGLSHATQEVVLALDAVGFDVILVETAGVGQTELGILSLAQTVIVVLVPESGDSIQVMKAGLLEIADVFAVNKSDRPESDLMVKELSTMLSLVEAPVDAWIRPVLKTEAHRGVGVPELVSSVKEHQAYLTRTGERDRKRREFLKDEVLQILQERLRARVESEFASSRGAALLDKVFRRLKDPYSAADELSGLN